MERFIDRTDAGRRLGAAVLARAFPRPVVLGLPRGGVPVAAEVAAALGAPLDVLIVRKLGLPFQREVAMGAIGENGARVLNEDVIRHARVDAAAVRRVEEVERAELAHRSALWRRGRAPLDLRSATAIVVDDGVATGATARAACRVARALGAQRVVIAVPVAAPDALAELVDPASGAADEAVCLSTPEGFMAVGMHYRDFAQTPDDEVSRLLDRHGRAAAPDPPAEGA